jgi:DNA replication initiation complex subunit (GINS family)
MTKEYMERIFKWSEGKVSAEAVQNVLKNMGQKNMTVEERALMTKHLEFRAFASTAWTVWSR